MTARCTLVVPDAGPFNSLWVADRLDLLLELRMPIVVIDAVYDELTADPTAYAKDREVKSFLDAHLGAPVILQATFVGQQAREARARGTFTPGRGIGEAAIVEFLNDGLERLADRNEPVLLLFEDADFRTIHFIRKPDNVHLLSTVAMLRGLEECGVIPSADAIVDAMVNPPDPARRCQARRFADLPRGTDDQAGSGSRWKP